MNAISRSTAVLAFAVLTCASMVAAQNGGPGSQPGSQNGSAPANDSGSFRNSSGDARGNGASTPSFQAPSQNPLFGSVPDGKPVAGVLSLSLSDAIERGLRQNLAQLLSNDTIIAAQGELWQRRSVLLPNISANVSEHAAQVDLAAQGFQKIAGRFPGFPLIVGPFGYLDIRGVASQSLLDFNALANTRSSQQDRAAARSSYRDTREMVVLVVGAAYFQTIAYAARVENTQAELTTAQAISQQASDLKNVGAIAGIDLLRAQVEVQTRQQQLIAARNDLAKQKLALARIIGIPLGQSFNLSDTAPYEAPPAVLVEDALMLAYTDRADFQAAQQRQKSAEYARRAATAERLPSALAYGDYGLIGPTPSTMHGSFDAYVSLHIPIFAGNRAHGDALVAEAALQRSRQELENLRAQIEQDVRTAILDLQSSSDEVTVAKSNVDLAQQTLAQARDRFAAGITNNIEVVQAQQSVANATEGYISSLYSYNLARVELARATGSAERGIRQYGKGQ